MQRVKGIEIFTIKVASSVARTLSSSSDYTAAISAAVRAIEMPRESSQQECSIILFALGHEAVVKVNS